MRARGRADGIRAGNGRPRSSVRLLAAAVAVALTCFSVRRLVLLAAALLPPRELAGAGGEPPSCTLVVAARNEAPCVDSVLAAIESLDYPAGSLFTVLVDDCSDDLTGERFADWARGRPRTVALRLSSHVGKYQALNEGMVAAPPSELIVFCDGDLRPRADCLRRLGEAFADDGVGAAAAFLAPDNPAESPIARYAAVESWVHQLVTSAGKDRLDLNPPMLGCCAYRRLALEQIGWFGPEAGEDVRATVGLTRAGWRTRFVPTALADNTVVSRWVDYWHQHVRWARNLFAATGSRRTAAASVPVSRRFEAWALSAGYADRLVLLAALPLMGVGRLRFRFAALYFAVIGCEVGAALAKAGVARDRHRYLLWTGAFFALDVAASVTATGAHARRGPRRWPHPRQ
jgi:cellulose synthase/poly-beta-1,6-N-acetylglucosamine synthase-like glycosyltransferase